MKLWQLIHNTKSYCTISVLIDFILVKFNNSIIIFKFLAARHILKKPGCDNITTQSPNKFIFHQHVNIKKTPLYGININKREVSLKLTCTPKLLTDLLHFISGEPKVYSYFTSIFLHLVWLDILLWKGSFNDLFTNVLLTRIIYECKDQSHYLLVRNTEKGTICLYQQILGQHFYSIQPF